MRAARVLLPMSLALTLAACGTTGSNPPPPEPPEPTPPTLPAALAAGLPLSGNYISGTEVYDDIANSTTVENLIVGPAAVTLTQAPVGQIFTATIGGNEYNLFSGEVEDTQSFHFMALANSTDSLPAPDGAPNILGGLFFGDHAAMLLLTQSAEISEIANSVSTHIAYGGTSTPLEALPPQTASYEGFWILNVADGRPLNPGAGFFSNLGMFEATADFDDETILFALTGEQSIPLGNGSGTISGNTFESSFNVLFGGSSANNTATGGFYGPGGEEIAGSIIGELNTGQTTIGGLIGTATSQ